MGASRAWGPLRGQHRLDAPAGQPRGRRGGRLPVSRLPFARGPASVAFLPVPMRRKHRFGAETVSPEGETGPVLLRSGVDF
ncbi:hypothetical protein AX27061_0516 [Achromobacter xylosoxidans NBRC 15126 = ATCC 27061]|nr:hypothetical protein AX27061_0516 [Achromobacter xylosoxidans NBRC 15126 = ATCC 27061]CCH05647.1 hypothetical protein NH44784_016751 [Achromobacter xylosoxidans NH44784-1996]